MHFYHLKEKDFSINLKGIYQKQGTPLMIYYQKQQKIALFKKKKVLSSLQTASVCWIMIVWWATLCLVLTNLYSYQTALSSLYKKSVNCHKKRTISSCLKKAPCSLTFCSSIFGQKDQCWIISNKMHALQLHLH